MAMGGPVWIAWDSCYRQGSTNITIDFSVSNAGEAGVSSFFIAAKTEAGLSGILKKKLFPIFKR